MLSGNVDAVVLYSPPPSGHAGRSRAAALYDTVRKSAAPGGLWIAPDKFIAEKPQVVQKAVNALFGAVVFLQDKGNRAGPSS
jgi:NitT/TauT family transport system substrate-binding protein